MSKYFSPRTAAGVGLLITTGKTNVTDDLLDASGEATKEHLERLAELVADGRIELPGDLPHESLQRLVTLVREIRRHRLVTFIARCIAVDILKTGDSAKEK